MALQSIAITCESCGTALVGEGLSAGQQVECPSCGAVTTVPPTYKRPHSTRRRGSSHLIPIIVFVMLMVGTVTGWLVIRHQDAGARQLAAKQTAAQEEALAKDLLKCWQAADAAKQEALTLRTNYDDAEAGLVAAREKLADTEYAAKAEAALAELTAAKRQAVDAIVAEIQKKAEPLLEAHAYTEVAKLMRDYEGRLATDTKGARYELADGYDHRARSKQIEIELWRVGLGEYLVKADLMGLRSEVGAFIYRGDCKEIVAAATAATEDARDTIWRSFGAEVGQEVEIDTLKGSFKVSLVKVEGDQLYIARQVGTRTARAVITLDQLSVAEHAKRLEGLDANAQALYLCAAAAERQEFEQAGTYAAKSLLATDALGAQFQALALKRELEAVTDPEPVVAVKPPETTTPGVVPAVDERPAEPEAPRAILPRRLSLRAIIHKAARDAGGYDYDDQRQRISARVSVTNNSRIPLKDYQTELYVIGRSVTESKTHALLKGIKKPISAAPMETGNSEETQLFVFFDDNRYAQFGYRYYGYLVVLRGLDGEILLMNGTRTKFEKIYETISGLREGQLFELDGTVLPGRTSGYY